MKIKFSKYQGAGNDFIMIDARNSMQNLGEEQIKFLCDRHFGIGADGLILLSEDPDSDFRMKYYNADGREGSMCGNGGRCIIRFAEDLGIIKGETVFSAFDGLHKGTVRNKIIRLEMGSVNKVEVYDTHVFLDTGSPHHIEFVEDVSKTDVKTLGEKIRWGAPYFEEGSNVDFVEILSDGAMKIRTFERGVEDETLACGTGITAAVLAADELGKIKGKRVEVMALGGNLAVEFEKTEEGIYTDIILEGPAEKVFEGEIEIEENL